MSVLNGDVMRSELLRFKWVTGLLTLAHVMTLVFLNRLADMQQQTYPVDRLFMLTYMAVAFLWAIFQIGSYRKASKWLWLLHRPVPHHTMFASMVAVAAINLLICVFVPMLATLLVLDFGSDRLIDAHRYGMPVHGWVLALSAWLAGVCAVLSVRPTAAVVLIVPIWLMWSFAHSASVLFTEVLGMLVLLAIASTQFKPNRDEHVRSNALVVLTALPLQMGLYFVLVIAAIGYEFLMMFAGTHPLNMPVPPRGGYTEAVRQEPAELLSGLLAASKDERAAVWAEQMPLLTPQSISTRMRSYPVRHQAYQERIVQWEDSKQRIEWTFSHDDMMFHGRDVRSGASKGVWGVKGFADPTPFAQVPTPFDGQYLLTPRVIYQIDLAQQRTLEQVRLADDEVFIAAPLTFGEQVLAVTSQGMRLFGPDRATYDQTAGTVRQLSERQVWRIPGVPFVQAMGQTQGAGSLSRLDAAELVDGWLIGLTFGGYYNGESIRQILLHVDAQGAVQVLAERALQNDFPVWYETVAWWLSPVHFAVRHAPVVLLDNGIVQGASVWGTPDAAQLTRALVLNAASVLLALWWMRRTALQARRKLLWLVMTALGGLPALLSLLLIEKRLPKPSQAGAVAGVPA
ncbi:hypothetical protein [Kinneretia aquatilis]|nr:hypothetical protein [Paucibacter aquatile]